jgi:long-subunit fatty acid transport protein
VAKLGVMVDARPFTFGMSLTTPSLNLLGQGTSFVDLSTSRIDSTGSTGSDFYASNLQKDRKSEFPTSWAVGMGAGYHRGPTEYTLAVEWYAPIDQFQIIETTPFQSQSTGQTLKNEVVAEYKSVLNWGVGVQHRFSSTVAAYGSFTTDFSAVVPENTNSVITRWDLYHLTAGGEFSVNKLHLTLGLEWAFGKDTINGIDLSEIDSTKALWQAGDSDVRYDKFTIILGIKLGGENL